MLVTAGLNDPRVSYWEPAKWVAKLRALKTDNRLLLLKTNMGSGHFGASGRYEYLKETAVRVRVLAGRFILNVYDSAAAPQTKIQLTNTSDYREHYANSVQVRVSLWDFFLLFGTMNQSAPDTVTIHNFEGVYPEPAAGQGARERAQPERLAVRIDLRRNQAGAETTRVNSVRATDPAPRAPFRSAPPA